ncbi:MAG: hypothetical protein ACP5HS_05670 [Anaerolineae bacterium]
MIASRELSRLRSRFGGRARPIVLIAVLVTVATSLLAYRQQAIRGRSLYRVGVTDDAPALTDPRFHGVEVTPTDGRTALNDGRLDILLDGPDVLIGQTRAADYAAGALELYLEEVELARISEAYPEDEAFPLRVNITTFPLAGDGGADRVAETVVPSLMAPPMPFADVLKVSAHLFPLFLVSVFFTSGLMEERRAQRVSVLLSTPVSPLDVIVGKTLPYILFALLAILALTALFGATCSLLWGSSCRSSSLSSPSL